jgi:hypothetical protein
MPLTLTLQNSINFVSPILKNQPLLVSNNEPALTAANLILGTMLGPPFKWPFNRNSYSFPITKTAGTDYKVTLADFSHLETQWLTDPTSKIYQLSGAVSLASEGGVARPTKIAPQYDDDAGNITFRFNSIPDQNYTAFIDYQKRIALMGAPASPWGVVPDRFSYIYNQGFLAMMSLLVNDARFPIFEGYFLARLLGAQDGLTDQERNIFIGNWMEVTQTIARSQSTVAVAAGGRGR